MKFVWLDDTLRPYLLCSSYPTIFSSSWPNLAWDFPSWIQCNPCMTYFLIGDNQGSTYALVHKIQLNTRCSLCGPSKYHCVMLGNLHMRLKSRLSSQHPIVVFWVLTSCHAHWELVDKVLPNRKYYISFIGIGWPWANASLSNGQSF